MRSGIGPDKLLFAKDRSVSAVRFAISGDIDPEMPILDKFNDMTRIFSPS